MACVRWCSKLARSRSAPRSTARSPCHRNARPPLFSHPGVSAEAIMSGDQLNFSRWKTRVRCFVTTPKVHHTALTSRWRRLWPRSDLVVKCTHDRRRSREGVFGLAAGLVRARSAHSASLLHRPRHLQRRRAGPPSSASAFLEWRRLAVVSAEPGDARRPEDGDACPAQQRAGPPARGRRAGKAHRAVLCREPCERQAGCLVAAARHVPRVPGCVCHWRRAGRSAVPGFAQGALGVPPAVAGDCTHVPDMPLRAAHNQGGRRIRAGKRTDAEGLGRGASA